MPRLYSPVPPVFLISLRQKPVTSPKSGKLVLMLSAVFGDLKRLDGTLETSQPRPALPTTLPSRRNVMGAEKDRSGRVVCVFLGPLREC